MHHTRTGQSCPPSKYIHPPTFPLSGPPASQPVYKNAEHTDHMIYTICIPINILFAGEIPNTQNAQYAEYNPHSALTSTTNLSTPHIAMPTHKALPQDSDTLSYTTHQSARHPADITQILTHPSTPSIRSHNPSTQIPHPATNTQPLVLVTYYLLPTPNARFQHD